MARATASRRRRQRPFVALGAALAIASGGCAPSAGTPTPHGEVASGTSLGWQDVLTGGPDRLDVATTVAPISSIVRNIGGDRIRLRGIIPDATNSHTFDPAPSDAQTLARADLIVVNGLHLEQPTLEMAAASKAASTQIASLGDETITEKDWLFDFSFPESAGDPNPHVWMNPSYAGRYADAVRDWFGKVDPANAAVYDVNYAAYKVRLDQLDAMIRKGVMSVPAANRKLLTYHDSWAYWAREYGFTVIGAVQASDFSDPSPQEVGGLIEQIRAEHVPAVFGSEVFPSPVLEQIARESGAAFVDKLRDDEPPGPPLSAEHTYLGMMKNDMEAMIGALGGDPTIFASLEVADTWRR
jgi:ABC-type Zn uptake system ZnuABC Zn-binding protein ZnuA